MSRVRTSLLATLALASLLISVIAFFHLTSARDQAIASAQDAATCRQYLSDLRSARTSQESPDHPPAGEDGAINQLLRDAAAAADATRSLTGIEPGQATRIEGTDYQETPIFLRLEPMRLKQLVTFLHNASARDPRVRCRSIELSAADSPDAWSADITMGWLSYAPKGVNR